MTVKHLRVWGWFADKYCALIRMCRGAAGGLTVKYGLLPYSETGCPAVGESLVCICRNGTDDALIYI